MIFHTKSVVTQSKDHNPGAFNAFEYGGFACGLFTLLGDLLKGFIPVYLYCRFASPDQIEYGLPAVLAAPVLGHIFPIFFNFQGGKGIAVSFGCYLGVAFGMNCWAPVLDLAVLFLFFTLIFPVQPHLYLTAIVFALHPIFCLVGNVPSPIVIASAVISCAVLARLAFSKEPKPKMEVRFLWKR